MNSILYNHFHDFYQTNQNVNIENLTQRKRIELQHQIFKQMLQNNIDSQDHIALHSRKHELAYLRQIAKQVLPFLLPENVLKCKVSNDLVEEIMVSNLLLKGIDICAEPDTLNRMLLRVYQSHRENKTIPDIENKKYVQILKHWTQMNGLIFKSVIKIDQNFSFHF